MIILVTGANGGLGKSLFPLIQSRYKDSEVIKTSRNGEAGYSCDLSDPAQVESLVQSIKPNLIFHLAASFTGEYETDVKANVQGFKHICDALINQQLKAKLIVFGSAAEYGMVQPEENPISEDHALNPVSVYGLTKSMQTEQARYYAKNSALEIIVARLFNLAIPGLSTRLFYGRAENLIQQFINGQIHALEFGNLDSVRDYIGLNEAAKQIFAIADFGQSGEVYHVGSGKPITIRSILYSMLEQNDLPKDIIAETTSEVIGRKGFDVPVIYADVTKTRKLLN